MEYDIKKNTLEECLNHWANPKDHNQPENYNKSYTSQRSKYLYGLLKKYKIPTTSRILEIGCNCCRNLNYIYSKGYNKLTGIEINKKAVELQKELFPKLKANIINSSIEDYILYLNDNKFDVVFTMAVIQHIHLDSNWIFEHIARINKKWLIIIELDLYRDYKNIFTNLGYEQIEIRSCKLIQGLEKYKARIFKKVN
jgi:SAM-dependent methyltransferase